MLKGCSISVFQYFPIYHWNIKKWVSSTLACLRFMDIGIYGIWIFYCAGKTGLFLQYLSSSHLIMKVMALNCCLLCRYLLSEVLVTPHLNHIIFCLEKIGLCITLFLKKKHCGRFMDLLGCQFVNFQSQTFNIKP